VDNVENIDDDDDDGDDINGRAGDEDNGGDTTDSASDDSDSNHASAENNTFHNNDADANDALAGNHDGDLVTSLASNAAALPPAQVRTLHAPLRAASRARTPAGDSSGDSDTSSKAPSAPDFDLQWTDIGRGPGRDTPSQINILSGSDDDLPATMSRALEVDSLPVKVSCPLAVLFHTSSHNCQQRAREEGAPPPYEEAIAQVRLHVFKRLAIDVSSARPSRRCSPT
jgi:hypothetical protein